MKTKLFVVLLAVFAASACAQSAQMMDSIISSAKLTYGQAAYLILTATEQIDDTAAFSDAFRTLKESGLIKAAALPTTDEAAIPLKNYALLVMKAFGIHGGMHYRIVPPPPPRYAYRDLCYYAVIQGTADPDSTITGVTALQIAGRAADLKGGK